MSGSDLSFPTTFYVSPVTGEITVRTPSSFFLKAFFPDLVGDAPIRVSKLDSYPELTLLYSFFFFFYDVEVWIYECPGYNLDRRFFGPSFAWLLSRVYGCESD